MEYLDAEILVQSDGGPMRLVERNASVYFGPLKALCFRNIIPKKGWLDAGKPKEE